MIDFRSTGVLVALMVLHERDRRVTMRGVADATGLSLSVTYGRLRKLRGLGLVDWKDGSRGTLRPLVRRAA